LPVRRPERRLGEAFRFIARRRIAVSVLMRPGLLRLDLRDGRAVALTSCS